MSNKPQSFIIVSNSVDAEINSAIKRFSEEHKATELIPDSVYFFGPLEIPNVIGHFQELVPTKEILNQVYIIPCDGIWNLTQTYEMLK